MLSYVVTGASRGLGLGFVRQLSSDQTNTVFALVRDKPGAVQLHKLVASNENIHVIQADLRDYKSIKAAAEEVSKATGGTLDVLINNGAMMYYPRSGLSLDKFPDEETLENDLLNFFKTNVIGVTHTLNAFLPFICAGSTKKVIFISSAMGSPHYALQVMNSFAPAYSISKAGLNMVFAKYAAAYKDKGLTFLAVSPGLMKTLQGPEEFVNAVYDKIVEDTRVNIPNFSTVSVEDSVRDQLALFERITPADSGAFVHYNGEKWI